MPYEPRAGDVIDDRYTVISSKGLVGGMAIVYKCIDARTQRPVAMKMAKSDILSKDGLSREGAVLRRLHPHPHIVGYVGETIVVDSPALILEWVDSDLSSRIANYKNSRWPILFADVINPILSALHRAHSLEFQHRDIHPGNVMFTAENELRIIDFGIAQIPKPPVGTTFFRHGLPPYTPENQNDRGFGFSRDCYSVAAVIVSCAIGKLLSSYEDLMVCLHNLDPERYPTAILKQCVQNYPGDCPANAGLLRTKLRQWTEQKFPDSSGLSLIVETPSMGQLTEVQEGELWQDVLDDLCSGGVLQITDGDDDTPQVDVGGNKYRASFDLVAPRAGVLRLNGRVKLNRIGWSDGFVPLVFSLFDQSIKAEGTQWNRFVDKYEEAADEEAKLREKARLEIPFASWENYLSAEHDLLLKKPTSIKYKNLEQVTEREFRFEFENSAGKATLSEDVSLLSGQSKRNLIRVVEIDDMRVRAIAKHPISLPNEGTLSVEYHAIKQALNRKRKALDTVRGKFEPASGLADFIMSPQKVPSPESSGRTFGITDDHQARAVDACIGSRGWVMIEGPPGTGKSTLIADIIRIFKEQNTNTNPRILLAAQTHIAIDTVLRKLVDGGHDGADIVRIPSGDIEKIDPAIRHLLVENKVKQFRDDAMRRSEIFLEKFAKQTGGDHHVTRVAIFAGLYRALADEIVRTRNRLTAAEIETKNTINQFDEYPDENAAAVTRTVSVVSTEEQFRDELAELQTRLSKLREQMLVSVPELSDALNDEDPAKAMEEFDTVFSPELQNNPQLAALVRLQLDWLRAITAGRALHQAIVQDSSIVSGTCVGLGSAVETQEFDLCIVDEASKALPVEALIPLSRSKRWILVGDVNQLPPHVDRDIRLSPEELHWASTSLLESLTDLSRRNDNGRLPPWHLTLRNQRRMVKGISDLISGIFYKGALIPLRANGDRDPTVSKAYKKPVTWIDVCGTSYEDQNRTRSLYNEKEIEAVLAQLNMLERVANKSARNNRISVAIVAGYAAQVDRISARVDELRHQWQSIDIDVASIDRFQGNEKDIAIVSLVRGSNERTLGHLDEKRVNVALSRAKDALVIIGSTQMVDKVATGSKLAEVLEYIRKSPNDCYVTSPQ